MCLIVCLLQIGADGIHSITRSLLINDGPPVDRGRTIWRAVIPRTDDLLPAGVNLMSLLPPMTGRVGFLVDIGEGKCFGFADYLDLVNCTLLCGNPTTCTRPLCALQCMVIVSHLPCGFLGLIWDLVKGACFRRQSLKWPGLCHSCMLSVMT